EGKLRVLWKGSLGWGHSLYGVEIHLGHWKQGSDDKDQEVNGAKLDDTKLIAALAKTINLGDRQKTDTIAVAGMTITIERDKVTITGASGDVVVDGVSLVNHTHAHGPKPDKSSA